MTTTKSHRNTLLVVIGVLMLLLALAAGCTSLVDPLPAGTGISPLQVVTPTPAHAQLQILRITTVPSISAGIFNVVPLGETFVLVTATVQNTGSGPLQPALAEVQLLDAADQAFLRSKEAEFVLRQEGCIQRVGFGLIRCYQHDVRWLCPRHYCTSVGIEVRVPSAKRNCKRTGLV